MRSGFTRTVGKTLWPALEGYKREHEMVYAFGELTVLWLRHSSI